MAKRNKEQRTQIEAELKALLSKGGGTVSKKQVVAYAKRNKTSAIRAWLDKKGAFDPKKAIDAYSSALAQSLLMSVTILTPDGAGETFRIRAYVSLPSDRKTGVGYRDVMDVMSNDASMAELESTFLQDLGAFERRYDMIRKAGRFADVFAAIRAVSAKEAAA